MQPANLTLDPMANLWPSSNSPNSNGYFPTTNASMSPPEKPKNAPSNSAINSAPNGGLEQRDAGDTFMGASTPGWKWSSADATGK